MELSSFSENIITETFERSGETLELRINIDAVVPDYYDVLDQRLAPTMERLTKMVQEHGELTAEIDRLIKAEKPKKGKKAKADVDVKGLSARATALTKEVADLNREVYAERLTCPVQLPSGATTCLLKGWDMTENGMGIEASKENLLRLPPSAVQALYGFVSSNLETVKKKVESETRETSETTHDGSPGLRVVAPTG